MGIIIIISEILVFVVVLKIENIQLPLTQPHHTEIV